MSKCEPFGSERRVFDVPEVIEAMRRAVAFEGPEHTVENCVYRHQHGGEPVCIVGQALAMLGILPSLEELRQRAHSLDVDADTSHDCNSTFFHNLAAQFSLPLEQHAVTVLRRAQAEQDVGRSWGHALEAAQELARGLGYDGSLAGCQPGQQEVVHE